MFLVTLTVCQCGPCTRIQNTGKIYRIFCCPYLSYKLKKIPCRLLPASFTIAVKLIVSKPHPILSFPRSVFEQISAISPSY